MSGGESKEDADKAEALVGLHGFLILHSFRPYVDCCAEVHLLVLHLHLCHATTTARTCGARVDLHEMCSERRKLLGMMRCDVSGRWAEDIIMAIRSGDREKMEDV